MMNQHNKTARFKTHADATAAGYIRPRTNEIAGLFAPNSDLAVSVVDISGAHSYGYRFAIKVQFRLDFSSAPDECIIAYRAVSGRVLAKSTTCWYSDEMNQMRQPGSFGERFAPEDLAQAVEAWGEAVRAYTEAKASAIEDLRPKTLLESIRIAILKYQQFGLDAEDTICHHDGRTLKIWCNLGLQSSPVWITDESDPCSSRTVTGEFIDLIQAQLVWAHEA